MADHQLARVGALGKNHLIEGEVSATLCWDLLQVHKTAGYPSPFVCHIICTLPFPSFFKRQGQGNDGHMYTLLRHSQLECCVELWHDSLGALHVVVPYKERKGEDRRERAEYEKELPYTTHCVFSTG